MSRRKRMYRNIRTLDGRDGVMVTPPDDWLEMGTNLPPAMADAFVRDLRAAGCVLWLTPDRDRPGNVRTRMLFPEGAPHDERLVRVLAKYARDIGKAIARSGQWNPPPDNPWNDQPLPPGGQWDWREM